MHAISFIKILNHFPGYRIVWRAAIPRAQRSPSPSNRPNQHLYIYKFEDVELADGELASAHPAGSCGWLLRCEETAECTAEARARKRFEQIRNGDAARRSATVQHQDNTIPLKERDRSPLKEDDTC